MLALGFVFAAFVVGSVVGSFANVCIHRLPCGESIVRPGSHCVSCGAPVAFYDNVPLLGWLNLRGKCRQCRAPISWRYPAVELLMASLFGLCALRYGPTVTWVSAALLSASSVILIATDLESRVLPDEVTLGTLVMALLMAGVCDVVAHRAIFRAGQSALSQAVLGALVGGGMLLAVRAAYEAVRGVEGMGLGDVKMIAMAGALTGAGGVFLTLLFSSVAGSVVGLGFIAWRRARWAVVTRRVRLGDTTDLARAEGFLVDASGILLAAGPRWREIPGAAAEGGSVASASGAARPLAAFARLARRRARAELSTEYGRLALDDGHDFFRVLAVRAEPVPQGILFLVDRSDIPFGVFLALGSLATFAFGRAFAIRLFGSADLPGMMLLP
jgi:leader peptidase (prepilin peptidase)/N-methyltransferase